MINHESFVVWTVFFAFLFSFSFLTMAPQVWERKIAHLFTSRKIMIIFKPVELEHTPWSFLQPKRWSVTVRSKKKKKKALSPMISSDNSCFFTHNEITTPKDNKRRSRDKNENKIAFSLISKVQEPSAFHSESSRQAPLLGLLLRGCRPKARSLPGRIEVIHPFVRGCTTFWLTSTRITLTRVHRLALFLSY